MKKPNKSQPEGPAARAIDSGLKPDPSTGAIMTLVSLLAAKHKRLYTGASLIRLSTAVEHLADSRAEPADALGK